ncbi:fumarate hydratase [Mollicutes bacterium LVI A0039]|nr:fumarate hydratase [Mollicutes bacterium LVI A0039]
MKKIDRNQLVKEVAKACVEANIYLAEDVATRIDELANLESNSRAKSILSQLEQNRQVASKTKLPLCQDTGICVMFIKLGNQVQIDFDLYEALNEAIRLGYDQGNLRKSVVKDPLFRTNTGDNTPGIYHLELTSGDNLEIIVAPKGAGSENMSSLKMMNPQSTVSEVEDFIYDCVVNSGGKPCPPIVVGVGIGGTFEVAAINAKRAAISPVGEYNSKTEYAEIEKRLIARINQSGIGPMGLGGDSTCLDVSIIESHSHIASLPVAVNIQCHVARHKVVKL